MSAYRTLLSSLDDWFARGVESAGADVIPCASGCSSCCMGIFDISAADAALLAQGLAALPVEQADELRSRAAEQLKACAQQLPSWTAPWDVDDLSEATFDALIEQLPQAACPALDRGGRCSVYEYRPATCRMTGRGMDAGAAGGLENECPIQGDHPVYAALPPEPFELIAFERNAARHDTAAAALGYTTTTVAGALVRPPDSRGPECR